MSRSGELWMTEHTRAMLRFVSGTDDKQTFVTNLKKLGFYGPRILDQIRTAEEVIAQIAHDAGADYFNRVLERSRT